MLSDATRKKRKDPQLMWGQANIFLLILLIVVLGFAAFYVITKEQQGQTPHLPTIPLTSDGRTLKPMYDAEWEGTIRAGKTSPLLEFRARDFSKALAGERLVVVYYYSPSCSRCMQEIPELIAVFNTLESDAVVGFMMNRDDPRQKDEIASIARDHGIGLDNTKAFFRHGGRVFKAIDVWDRERYFREIVSFAPR